MADGLPYNIMRVQTLSGADRDLDSYSRRAVCSTWHASCIMISTPVSLQSESHDVRGGRSDERGRCD